MIESIEDLDPLDRAVHRMKELEMVIELDGDHTDVKLDMVRSILRDFEDYITETEKEIYEYQS